MNSNSSSENTKLLTQISVLLQPFHKFIEEAKDQVEMMNTRVDRMDEQAQRLEGRLEFIYHEYSK